MLQIKRERKIRPYKKRKRIKEKKIELYKKRRKIKDENFFDNQPQLISLLAPEVIQENKIIFIWEMTNMLEFLY